MEAGRQRQQLHVKLSVVSCLRCCCCSMPAGVLLSPRHQCAVSVVWGEVAEKAGGVGAVREQKAAAGEQRRCAAPAGCCCCFFSLSLPTAVTRVSAVLRPVAVQWLRWPLAVCLPV